MEEDNLEKRARTLDADISEIVQEVGEKTTKKVLTKSCDKIVEKKVRRTDSPQK